eukprot:6212517-Pleurochrysis_carterae.AAC.18
MGPSCGHSPSDEWDYTSHTQNDGNYANQQLRVQVVAETDRAPHAHAGAGVHARDAQAWQHRRGVLGVFHDASQPVLQCDAPPPWIC